MMGHKICFYEEILIIIPKLSLLLLLIWSPDAIPRKLKIMISHTLKFFFFTCKESTSRVLGGKAFINATSVALFESVENSSLLFFLFFFVFVAYFNIKNDSLCLFSYSTDFMLSLSVR